MYGVVICWPCTDDDILRRESDDEVLEDSSIFFRIRFIPTFFAFLKEDIIGDFGAIGETRACESTEELGVNGCESGDGSDEYFCVSSRAIGFTSDSASFFSISPCL